MAIEENNEENEDLGNTGDLDNDTSHIPWPMRLAMATAVSIYAITGVALLIEKVVNPKKNSPDIEIVPKLSIGDTARRNAIPFIQPFVRNGRINKTFYLNNREIQHSFNLDNYLLDVRGFDLPQPDRYIRRSAADMNGLSELVSKIADSGLSNMLKTARILDFVDENVIYIDDDEVPYKPDSEKYVETAKTGLQTLVDGTGDCDDFSRTACDLLNLAGVSSGLAYMEYIVPEGENRKDSQSDHMVIALKVPYDTIRDLEYDSLNRRLAHIASDCFGSGSRFKKLDTLITVKTGEETEYYILIDPQNGSLDNSYIDAERRIEGIYFPTNGRVVEQEQMQINTW